MLERGECRAFSLREVVERRRVWRRERRAAYEPERDSRETPAPPVPAVGIPASCGACAIISSVAAGATVRPNAITSARPADACRLASGAPRPPLRRGRVTVVALHESCRATSRCQALLSAPPPRAVPLQGPRAPARAGRRRLCAASSGATLSHRLGRARRIFWTPVHGRTDSAMSEGSSVSTASERESACYRGLLAERVDRYLVELDSGASATCAEIHRVEASSPRRIASSSSNNVTPRPLPALAVDEHEHLCALQPWRCVAALDLAAHAADRLIDIRWIALEGCDSCVHVYSSRLAAIRRDLRRGFTHGGGGPTASAANTAHLGFKTTCADRSSANMRRILFPLPS
jgi:hypothetical protein